MELLTPDKAIAALEEYAIKPYKHLHPTLGVIIRENAKSDEKSYLKSLMNKAKKYEAHIEVALVKDAIAASKAIINFKQSPVVNGIINLSHFGEANRGLNDMIPVRLDLDCASSSTLGMLMANTSPIGYRLAPCAAVAVMKMLEYDDVDLTGKAVAILGRSLRVGRPLAEIMCQQNATVTVFHSKSYIEDLHKYDIIVSAIGKAKYIDSDQIGCVELGYEEDIQTTHIIDVGINIDENGKLCGDVNREELELEDENSDMPQYEYIKITPVPGGIGSLATVVLFSKLFVNAATVAGELCEQ